MRSKKIHTILEQLINSLTINENHKTFLKSKTNDFYNELKWVSQYQKPYWSNIYLSTDSYKYTLERFWYRGSLNRGIFIKNRFNIDIYFVFNKNEIPFSTVLNIGICNNNINNQNNLNDNLLFELIYSHLKTYQYYYKMNIKILKNPPYRHSIPIRMDYQGISILFDCIPAIESPYGYLIIPNGIGCTKKVNPNLEEQILSKLNKRQNGKIAKLILLIKYWNFTWGKPLNGYLVERLVESIFDEININTWGQAVKIFFNRAISILDKKKLLHDRVFSQYSILNEHSSNELESFLKLLKEAASYAHNNEWEELFDGL